MRATKLQMQNCLPTNVWGQRLTAVPALSESVGGQKAVSPIPDDWKRLRFGDLFTPVKRKNIERNENVLTISAQDGLVNQLEFYNHPYASEDTSGYTLLTKGDFAYNKSYSGDCPYGAIKRLERYEAGVVSPLYLCFSPKPGVDGDFFVHYFNGGMLNRALYRIAQEGARNHGLLNIPTEGFFDAELIVPSPAEQRRITAILSACDRVVESKQKLLEEKRRQKRALMRMLLEPNNGDAAFSRVGETRPEGRIPRMVQPLCSFLDFKNGINAPKEHFGSGIKLISVREVLDEQPIRYDSIRASVDVPEETIKAYAVKFGDVLIQRSSENAQEAGSCNVYLDTKPAVFGGFVIRGKKKADYNPVFFRFLLQSQFVRRQIVGRAAGAQHFNVGQEDLESIIIPLFRKEEQDRIATIFAAADREIDGLAREIDAWKQKRKALSQLLLSGKVRV